MAESNGNIKLVLKKVYASDSGGIILKDRYGNVKYVQHDLVFLDNIAKSLHGHFIMSELFEALVTLDDKIKDVIENEHLELNLNKDESKVLNSMIDAMSNNPASRAQLEKPQIRSIVSLRKQLSGALKDDPVNNDSPE